MISVCDGCEMLFRTKLKRFNAKEWKPSLCRVPHEESELCSNIECDYNLEAECCIECQFCPKCLANKQIVDKAFSEFAIINKGVNSSG